MPYLYREDISIADAAIEVNSKTLEGVFIDAGKALTNTMIENLDDIDQIKKIEIDVSSDQMDLLLYEFLEQLVILKDSDRLIFNKFDIKINKSKELHKLKATLYGEEINHDKHELCADVKAVTLHKFKLFKEGNEWKATLILDI